MKIAAMVRYMQEPSMLNEWPDGSTNRTTGCAQPNCSRRDIMRGRTDSDEDVPSTMKISSRMNFRNCQRLSPLHLSNEPRTRNMNKRLVMYTQAIKRNWALRASIPRLAVA